MHKIFIAQKSYCVCRVPSLATIRSKYYFNFILNRTRSVRELFDHPSYMIMRWITFFHCVTWSRLYINSLRLVFYHVQYLSWCFLKYLVLSVIIVGRLSFLCDCLSVRLSFWFSSRPSSCQSYSLYSSFLAYATFVTNKRIHKSKSTRRAKPLMR